MGTFLSQPAELPEAVRTVSAKSHVDIVEMADLNGPTIDCTFHESYCLQKFNISYSPA
jgi:hypothetical protein